jgi:hypothetical protein
LSRYHDFFLSWFVLIADRLADIGSTLSCDCHLLPCACSVISQKQIDTDIAGKRWPDYDVMRVAAYAPSNTVNALAGFSNKSISSGMRSANGQGACDGTEACSKF